MDITELTEQYRRAALRAVGAMIEFEAAAVPLEPVDGEPPEWDVRQREAVSDVARTWATLERVYGRVRDYRTGTSPGPRWRNGG